jgi:hypothetical protein
MITTIKCSTNYQTLKKKLKKNTLLAGSGLVACNTVTGSSLAGIATGLGVATSFTYLSLLCNHVDKIEDSDSFQKHIAVPVTVAVFETWWNHQFPEYTLNQGYTLIGFLSYQFAVLTILYETVREMLTQPQPPPSSCEQSSSEPPPLEPLEPQEPQEPR